MSGRLKQPKGCHYGEVMTNVLALSFIYALGSLPESTYSCSKTSRCFSNPHSPAAWRALSDSRRHSVAVQAEARAITAERAGTSAGGNKRPFSPSRTNSGTPPVADAKTGVPTAKASKMTVGAFSMTMEGKIKAVADWSCARTASGESRPRDRTPLAPAADFSMEPDPATDNSPPAGWATAQAANRPAPPLGASSGREKRKRGKAGRSRPAPTGGAGFRKTI